MNITQERVEEVLEKWKVVQSHAEKEATKVTDDGFIRISCLADCGIVIRPKHKAIHAVNYRDGSDSAYFFTDFMSDDCRFQKDLPIDHWNYHNLLKPALREIIALTDADAEPPQESEPAKSIEEQVREKLSKLGSYWELIECTEHMVYFKGTQTYCKIYSDRIDTENLSESETWTIPEYKSDNSLKDKFRETLPKIAELLTPAPTDSELKERVAELESQLNDSISEEDHDKILSIETAEVEKLKDKLIRTEARMNMYIGWYENAQQNNDRLREEIEYAKNAEAGR